MRNIVVLLEGRPAARERNIWTSEQLLVHSPKLAIVQGPSTCDDAVAFAGYIEKKCGKFNIDCERIVTDSPESTIIALNHDPNVTGTVVTHPFSDDKSLDDRLINLVNPFKDVEGLHVFWTGGLTQYLRSVQDDEDVKYVIPFTPKAVVELLDYYKVPYFIDDQPVEATIINYSKIVGMPLARMLWNRGINPVNCCDENTPKDKLYQMVKNVDILISAANVEDIITGDMIKPGAAVIDVSGVDIDFDSVSENAGYLTPVKGGVGPVTTTMVLVNLLYLSKLQYYFFHGGRDPLLDPYTKDILVVK